MKTHERILTGISSALLGISALFIGIQHWRLRDLKFDDAWIHLRYAANLAAGKGFVYNEGERVLGSAGILWNLILAACGRIAGPGSLPAAVSIINFLALLGCAAAIIAATVRIVPAWYGLLIAAVLLSQGPLAVSSIGGMETTFLCLFTFLSIFALSRERWKAAAFCAGAAACFRVESVGLMAAVLLAAWLHDRRDCLKSLPALALMPCLVFGWSWWYFGSPIANSTRAKSIVYVLHGGDAQRWCVNSLLRSFPFDQAYPLGSSQPEAAGFFGLAVFVAFALLGYRLLRKKAPAAAVAGLQAIFPIVFYAVANPLMFPWYACTFLPIATILVLLGIFETGRRVAASRAALADALALTLVVSFSISPLRSTWPSLSPPDSPSFSFQAPNARESTRTYQYANIARWLNSQAGENDRVCISEIGAFGYFFRGKILDGLGLISPEALRFHPVPVDMRPGGDYGVIAPGVVKAFRPEYVVSLDIFAGALFADSWFHENYAEIGRWNWFGGPARWQDLPPTLWGASEIRAFRRR